jgi:hypothetical protein
LFFAPAAGQQPATASFVTTDTATGGQWTGVYGADGYSIIGGATNLPSYARIATAGASTYTWASSSNDPRASQPAPGATTGVAATDYAANTFSINLNLLDGKSHQVAAYLLDWDKLGRAETVQVTDSETGAVLDTRTVSNFASGEWLVWNLSGQVTITFTRTAGPNAVLSDLAFGGLSAPTPTAATFVQTDSTTPGKWTGTYGADGYDLLGAGGNLPAYARLSTATDQPSWTWEYTTADPRALLNGPGATTGVAACDYSANSFTLDLNLVDGKSHQVALYMVDYDSRNRAQTVQITDADSGTVLNTESVSDFTQGLYLVWNLTGHVKITVTNAPGSLNAVASGLFFG